MVDSVVWEDQKENIQPIAQGRKICALMNALSLVTDNRTKRGVFETKRSQFEEQLNQQEDEPDKQLDLWCAYIDWLEQNEPEGGKVSGLSNAIEQCIEKFYNEKKFKQDERLFEVFMKFTRFCDEPVEVFGFMYTNSVCTLLARFYLNWSWQYEIRRNFSRADVLLKLGLKNLASPRDVLEEARQQLKFRLDRLIRAGDFEENSDNPNQYRLAQAELANGGGGIRAALQTLKFKMTKKEGSKVSNNRTGIAVDNANVGGLKNQTMIVNGVRVAKKGQPRSKLSNVAITVLTECPNEDGHAENVQPTDENARNNLKDKIPTSQQINIVGRTGVENHVPARRCLQARQ